MKHLIPITFAMVLVLCACKKDPDKDSETPVDEKGVKTIVIETQAEMPSKMMESIQYFNDPEVSKIVYDIKPGKIVLGQPGAQNAPGRKTQWEADSLYLAMKAVVEASNGNAAAEFAAMYDLIEVAGPARIPAKFYKQSINPFAMLGNAPNRAPRKSGENPPTVPTIVILPDGTLYIEGKIYTAEEIVVEALIDAANSARRDGRKTGENYPIIAEEIVLNTGDATFTFDGESMRTDVLDTNNWKLLEIVKPEKLSSGQKAGDIYSPDYQGNSYGKMATVVDNLLPDQVTEFHNPTAHEIRFTEVNNESMAKVRMPGFDNPDALLNFDRSPTMFVREDTLHIGGKITGGRDYFDDDYKWTPDRTNWIDGMLKANNGAIERAPNHADGRVMLKPKTITNAELADSGNYHVEYDSVGNARYYPIVSIHELIFIARMADPVFKAWLTDTVAVEVFDYDLVWQYPDISSLGIGFPAYMESEGLGDAGMIKIIEKEPPVIWAPKKTGKPIQKPTRIDRSRNIKNFGRQGR